MAKDDPPSLHSQAFRLYSPPGTPSSSFSEVTLIEALFDAKTGELVVRWKDILRVFDTAKYIKQDNVAISFMTDSDLEEHRPGVVVDIVPWNSQPIRGVAADTTFPMLSTAVHPDTSNVSITHRDEQLTIESTLPIIEEQEQSVDNVISETIPASQAIEEDNDLQSPTTLQSETELLQDVVPEHTTTMNQRLAFLSAHIAEKRSDMFSILPRTDSTENALVLHQSSTTDITPSTHTSMNVYNQLNDSYFHAIMSGQVNQAESIKEVMNEHFGSLQVEMDKNKALQKRMLEMQEETLQRQQQVLDRLAIIQNRVQTIVTQTYELHEYPIPRLFIVLPMITRRRDRLNKIFSKQFRLYFLCECGAHTMREGTKIPHKIHLAKHEGYDLDRPTEFFEKYGPYVLTMMQMVKYGFTAAGIFVPALAHTGLVEGMDAIQQGLDFAQNNIGSLVDETISFIEDRQGSANGGMDLAVGDQNDMENLQDLEGADLRQLESYLSVSDKGRVLGNLYRIVTSEGHVKWVCLDHYRENYRESSAKQLKDSVASSGGTFIEETGCISIKLDSATVAKSFYGALTKARGIQELSIELQWDVTLDDLRTLAATMNKANVASLALNGKSFKGPAFDFINRGRRFDPILELMSNGRLQCLRLKNFEELCLRVNNSSIMMAPQLRLLEIDLSVSLYEKTAQSTFSNLLNHCTSLSRLEIDSYHQCMVWELVQKMDSFSNLETLVISSGGRKITLGLSAGRVRTMEMAIYQVSELSVDEGKFLDMGQVRKLEIAHTPTQLDEPRLTDILRKNPLLAEIKIGCQAERVPAIIKLVTSTRQELLSSGRPSALRFLEISKNKDTSSTQLGHNEIVRTMVVYRDDATEQKIVTNIDMSGSVDKESLSRVNEVFQEYSWAVERLTTNSMFDDRLAALLDQVTEEKGSQLRYLEIFSRPLSSAGLDSISRVIERSRYLYGLRFQFHGLKDPDQQEKAERMLRQHGKKITALLLNGFAANTWLSRFAGSLPTRRDLPEMQDFRIMCNGKQQFNQEATQWVVAMASSPPQDSSTSTSLSLLEAPSEKDALVVQSSQLAPSSAAQIDAPETWKPLKLIYLVCVSLQPEGWKDVIKGLDFSVVEEITLSSSNFSLTELKCMVDCIPEKAEYEAPLKFFSATSTVLSKSDDPKAVDVVVARLKKKAPHVVIKLTA
ncbi:hypothetical protein BGZ99_008989 [Dissophora globulifera]|uniref:Uncharacterized protein n=1 Tax=Dissophora globulifera TaxID=979702 RepID=A0A9P6RQV9_9FUNG|nr:hypothetical protein BGZ99_008989 [Dissophora globulifera]